MDPIHMILFAVSVISYTVLQFSGHASAEANSALMSLASLSLGVAAGKGAPNTTTTNTSTK